MNEKYIKLLFKKTYHSYYDKLYPSGIKEYDRGIIGRTGIPFPLRRVIKLANYNSGLCPSKFFSNPCRYRGLWKRWCVPNTTFTYYYKSQHIALGSKSKEDMVEHISDVITYHHDPLVWETYTTVMEICRYCITGM